MADRGDISERIRDHYDAQWRAGDPWDFAGSEYERQRYTHLFSVLTGCDYSRALEIGCGSGVFTRMLAGIARRVLAVDVAPAAVALAQRHTDGAGPGTIDFRVADILQFDLNGEGPWDLIVLSETIYSLGWLYPFFDVGYFACRLHAATAAGGRLLLSNTYGQADKDWLLQPYLIDTYRDLFRNVGFRIENEHTWCGTKDGIDFTSLVSLFHKPACAGDAADQYATA